MDRVCDFSGVYRGSIISDDAGIVVYKEKQRQEIRGRLVPKGRDGIRSDKQKRCETGGTENMNLNQEGVMTPVVGLGLRKQEVPIPKKNADRIGRIIRDGVRLRTQLETIKQAIEKNNELLIPHAENLAGVSGQKSVAFKSDIGIVEVKFSDAIKYLEKDMPKIKEILGPLFDQVFSTETTYAVNMTSIPELKKILKKKYDELIKEQDRYSHKKKLRDLLCDGDSEMTAELRKHVYLEPGKPTISFTEVA